jgi:rhodanese-related sulfurtransferase
MADNTNEAPASVPAIGIDELGTLVEANKVFLLDLRRSVHGEQIYGAIRYDPHKLAEAPRLVLPLPKDGTPIVLYDDDGDSKTLAGLSAKLLADGYAGVHTLVGGFAAWKAADGRMEEPTFEQIVPLVSEQQFER